MNTYKKLSKALKALKEFRTQSETTDENEKLRIEIVRLTDWGKLGETINDLESTLLSMPVQRLAK